MNNGPTVSGTASEWLAGLWHNNPVLVQMLGLCPLLAVTTSFVNGLTLGLATMVVLIATNVLISLLRNTLVPTVRIPLFVLLISALVTSVDLLMNAMLYDLHETLGLFIPLIITNCAILAQAETVASRNPIGPSAVSALSSGLGFLAVLVVLGALREVFGSGTLFFGLDLLLGPGFEPIHLNFAFEGMLVFVLPPGAFFGLAILLALRNFLIDRRAIAHSGDQSALKDSPI